MDAWLPFGHLAFAACAAAVLVAYVIFGLTSFGAPLIAAPVLAHFLPLTLSMTASEQLGRPLGVDRVGRTTAFSDRAVQPLLLRVGGRASANP
jgi:hypothetical protein